DEVFGSGAADDVVFPAPPPPPTPPDVPRADEVIPVMAEGPEPAKPPTKPATADDNPPPRPPRKIWRWFPAGELLVRGLVALLDPFARFMRANAYTLRFLGSMVVCLAALLAILSGTSQFPPPAEHVPFEGASVAFGAATALVVMLFAAVVLDAGLRLNARE